MKIQILGSDCPNCKLLYETTKKIAEELCIETEIEHITDINKIIELGIMTTPVLRINDKTILTGAGNSEDDVKKALLGNCFETIDEEHGCSSCGCCSHK